MSYSIHYYSTAVQQDILSLPVTLRARYVSLTERMLVFGPNLGDPHTSAFGDGLFELRLKGAEGIGRVFYCTMAGQRIVILHSFLKKTQKTPVKERRVALARLNEVKNAYT
jgi:phage-related protein